MDVTTTVMHVCVVTGYSKNVVIVQQAKAVFVAKRDVLQEAELELYIVLLAKIARKERFLTIYRPLV